MATLHPLAGLEQHEDDALQTALRRHVRELVEREPGVRLGADPEELHKQRVATRRLRSLLRSTRSQLEDPERADRLRDELRWLGGLLGEVRDRDVLIAYLLEELTTIDEAAAFGGILELLDAEREEARKELLAALDSPRYRALVDELERRRRCAKGSAWRPLQRRTTPGSAKRIRELVARVRGTGRTALAAGRLIERQQSRRAAARAAWPKAWKRLRRAGDDVWR